MKRKRKCLILELITGLLVIGIAVFALIMVQYESYAKNIQMTAEILAAENPETGVFQVLKNDSGMSLKETEKILKDYGYDRIASNRFGRTWRNRSICILAGGLILYIAYAAVLLYENKKTQRQLREGDLKIAKLLHEIREGDVQSDFVGLYEENSDFDQSLDELESLCDYLDMVMEQSRKEKEETKTLVTDISHQLKTPVAALNSCFEILKKGNLTVQEREEFEQRLENQLKGLEQLISALVNISRMETGMIELHMEKTRIFDTILEAVNRIWMKAQKKGIEIEMEMEDSLEELEIEHDRKWMCEALINILDNAVKYSPPDTKVTLDVSRRISYLRVEVRDQGIGIDKKEYHKVFQRFYRGEREEVQKEEGSGVGLYLTRKIIEGHHGTIALDARRMRKEGGSVFVLHIPY